MAHCCQKLLEVEKVIVREVAQMGAICMRIRHSMREFATQPVIPWIPLGGKPKWLPLNFGFNDVMRTALIEKHYTEPFENRPRSQISVASKTSALLMCALRSLGVSSLQTQKPRS